MSLGFRFQAKRLKGGGLAGPIRSGVRFFEEVSNLYVRPEWECLVSHLGGELELSKKVASLI